MKSKSHSGAQHETKTKPNLGQKEASLEKEKDAELSHMGERTRPTADDDAKSERKHK
jgi:hypothetical protein